MKRISWQRSNACFQSGEERGEQSSHGVEVSAVFGFCGWRVFVWGGGLVGDKGWGERVRLLTSGWLSARREALCRVSVCGSRHWQPIIRRRLHDFTWKAFKTNTRNTGSRWGGTCPSVITWIYMYSQTAFGWGVFFLSVYKVHAAGLYQLGAYFLFLFVSPRGLSLRPRRCIFRRNSISMDCFHKLSRPHYNLSWPLYLVHLGSTELDPPLSSKLSTWNATGCHVYAVPSSQKARSRCGDCGGCFWVQ